MPKNDTPIRTNRFLGLRDAHDKRAIGKDGLSIANNVDITNDLEVERRPGYVQVTTTPVDAAWGDGTDLIFTSSGSLIRLNLDDTEVTLASGLTVSSTLAVGRTGNRLYWSNDYETGVVKGNENRSLGLPVPDKPTVVTIGGAIPAGVYAFALSFLRSDDQESGLSLEALVTTTNRDGFSISIPASSTDSDVDRVNVYVSAHDGRQLYLLATANLGAAAVSFDDSTRRLGTIPAQFKHSGAPPPFQCAAVCNARLVVGCGENIYFSYPFAYEVFNLAFGYIPMQSRVEIIVPVEGGTYVGTGDQVLYMQGDISDPSDVRSVANYGVVRGSRAMPLESHEIDVEEFSGKGAAILTERGYALCLDRGRFSNVTEGEAVFPAAPIVGDGVIRRVNGTVHALSVVKT